MSFRSNPMRNERATISGFASILLLASVCLLTDGRALMQNPETEFGPVVRAYLGYLRNEQEVVDDRISRREISGEYYRRNSNRIRALRQMATRLVLQTGNDYVPELEAVTLDEFGTLFETPQNPRDFHVDGIVRNTFR